MRQIEPGTLRNPRDEEFYDEIAAVSTEHLETDTPEGHINPHAESLEREEVVRGEQNRLINPQSYSLNQSDRRFIDEMLTIEEGPEEEDRDIESLMDDEEIAEASQEDSNRGMQAISVSPIICPPRREQESRPTPPRFSPVDTSAMSLLRERTKTR